MNKVLLLCYITLEAPDCAPRDLNPHQSLSMRSNSILTPRLVQAMGNAPTRIFRLKGGCPSIVASLAFLLLVAPVGLAPTTARLKGECYIYMSFGAISLSRCLKVSKRIRNGDVVG